MDKVINKDKTPYTMTAKKSLKVETKIIKTSDSKSFTVPPNISISKPSPQLVKSTSNPEAEEFEVLIDVIRKAIRKESDHLKSIGRTSDEALKLFTGNVIKKHMRLSKWV